MNIACGDIPCDQATWRADDFTNMIHQRHRLHPHLAEAAILAALLILPLLFWWRLWAFDPADRVAFPEGDFAGQYYPLQLFAARELAAGRLPAWDPYLNAGQPGLADIQTGTFYPPNLLTNLLLAVVGLPFSPGVLTAQVILHFSLASLFTYLFVRHLARRAGARLPAARFAGAVAALSFTYAGYLTSFPVQQITILETAVWLPLVLLFVDLSVERGADRGMRNAYSVLAGMALACAFLAGHPQTAMYVVYATLAYSLFQATGNRQQTASSIHHAPRFPFSIFRSAFYVLLPLLIGATLSAVQLIPSLEFIARSTRAGLDYDALSGGFPLAELTHLLYPGYFGGSPQYVGILPPILALAALAMKQARRDLIFWTLLGAVALLLSFGGNTFLYNVAYLLAPGFGLVRNQERIIFLFSLAVSVLAGYGALALVQPLSRPERKGFRRLGRALAWAGVAFLGLTALWYLGYLQGQQQGVTINLFEGVLRHHFLLLLLLGGSALLLALRSGGKVRRSGLMALALGLIGFNLFTVNWQYNVIDPDYGGPRPAIAEGPFVETGWVAFLKGQPGTFRISSAGLLPGGASAGIVYGLEDITGNTPLRLESYRRFEEQVGNWRQLQLLNVQFVLSKRDLEGPGLERVYEEGGVRVYRVTDPLPRAWVVHHVITADDEAALQILNADDFDPRTTAVLPSEYGQPALSGGPGSAVQVVEARPGRLALEVPPGDEGLLVISQPFYPGWQAWVDGKPTPVYRADYLLQAIPLQAGARRVELAYHLSPLPAMISLAGLAGCLAGLIWGRRTARRRERPLRLDGPGEVVVQ